MRKRMLTKVDSNLKFKENRLSDNNDCPICFEMLIEPVKLECGHIYCFNCIDNLYRTDLIGRKCPQEGIEDDKSSFRCPYCRYKICRNEKFKNK